MLGRLLVDIFKRGSAGALDTPKSLAPAIGGTGDEHPNVLPLDDVNCLVKGRHGWFLANRFDHYLGRALIRYGEYNEVEHAFLVSVIRPGDQIIEVGANIGTHTIGLSKAVGAAGMVHAIEAQPAIFRVLCANLALNGLANVTPHACGCGAHRDIMSVPAIDYGAAVAHNSGSVSLAPAGAGVPVTVIPLDELAMEMPALRLIKIDVEGMEREVLAGAANLIAKHRPLLYVENDRFDKSPALIEWIMAAGYRLWWHTPPLFNPGNYFGTTENDYPNVVSANMFCQPADAAELSLCNGLIEIVDPAHHLLAR